MDAFSHCDDRDDLADCMDDLYRPCFHTPAHPAPFVADLPKNAFIALSSFRKFRAPLTPAQRRAMGSYAPGVVGTCKEFYALVSQLSAAQTKEDGKAIRSGLYAMGVL